VPWYAGWVFAVPLLAILLCHEFGHYIAARRHQVAASLPYFIPIPLVFGTFGAIIRMRGRITTRTALLDIGAAGPLAGMAVALPVLVYGLSISEVHPQQPGNYLLEGHSLLYELLLYLIHGPIPAGHDIFLHPAALAGWVGLFVTMLNLLPIGQLDGGHVAYALLGERQDRLSSVLLWLLPVLGVGLCASFGFTAWQQGLRGEQLWQEASIGANWCVWFVVLHIMRRYAGKDHPPVDPGALSTGRKVVGALCLLLLVFIFMPVPIRAVTVGEP
jgi:membrane-associated protease RseP (regulator of RpoE activity)